MLFEKTLDCNVSRQYSALPIDDCTQFFNSTEINFYAE